MNFIRTNEKAIVKSLFYGFIVGFFGSVLFLPKQRLVPSIYGQKVYESSPAEHIINILKVSVTTSLVAIAITLIYLYIKNKNKE